VSQASAPVLRAAGVSAGYKGHAFVHDLDFEVAPGEVVALFGPNGAGKTTTMLTLAGELAPLSGEVHFAGGPTRAPLHRRAAEGLSFVTEERSVFMKLTVAENLRVGRCDEARALEHFPELDPLLGRQAGKLSGGEQQMLTLARALTRDTKVLLIDELSLGLAPLIVERLLEAVRGAARSGIGVVLVEQHVEQALRHADRAYVMRRGRIILSGSCEEVSGRIRDLEESYLAA
jgi:branched-chain amino acid transport system ATP-binding protein